VVGRTGSLDTSNVGALKAREAFGAFSRIPASGSQYTWVQGGGRMDAKTGGFDLRAVGAGVLWGLVIMLVGALMQGLAGYASPLTGRTEDVLTLVWQALGPLVGGFVAARRAAGSGWLHGAVAGLALVLSVASVMGVASALPTLAVLLKMAGIGIGVGALGGVAGVNSAR